MKSDERSNVWVWVAAILVAGLALRLYRLGALGLAWDEDYLAITVRSILADGKPDFPSGLLYVRALPLSYLTAGLARLFGWSEAILRLPSVLFSTLSIAGVYWLGRRLISPRAGLLAALLMAVSVWEVEVGRTARMYAMLSTSCLMSLVLLLRAIERRSRWAGIAAACFGVLAAFTHPIGLGLVVMYACFLLHPKPDRWRIRLIACLIAVVSLGAVVNSRIVSHHAGRWWDMAEAVSHDEPAHLEREAPLPMRRVDQFSSRFLSPFLTLQKNHHGIFLTGAALAGVIALGLVLALARRPRDWLFAIISALLLITLCFQQLLLAVMVLIAYLLVGRVREPLAVRRRSLLLAVGFIVASTGWLLYWLLAGPAAATLAEAGLMPAAKQLLKPLIGYPPSFVRFYLARYPFVMNALAGVSCLVAGVRFWRTRRVDALALAASLFVVPTVALGFHPAALAHFKDRFIVLVDPYFLLLVAFAAVWIGERLRYALPVRKSLRAAAVGMYGLGLLVTSGFASARASLALVTANYGVAESGFDLDIAGPVQGFHPDLAGPAQFVCEHYEPSDVVIAMDILAHYAYCPVAHYQLALFGEPIAEGWFRAPSLASVDDLRDALERHRGARVWIVLEAVHLRRVEHDPRMVAILRLIESRAGEPQYRGDDGLSDVYLVEPHAPGHQGSPIPHGEPAADHELNPGRAARAGAP